jgi:hypothetical protein
MRTLFLASAAVIGLGVSSAFAGDGDGTHPNTYFTEIPGVVAQAPVQQQNSAYAANHTGAYIANHSTGTWIFPPDPYGGGDN